MNTFHRDTAGYHANASPMRLYRTITFLTLFSLLFGGFALLRPPRVAAADYAVTTDYLNLRTGPSLDADVITVMPIGAAVSVTGGTENGFYPVSYGDTWGYAHSDYIAFGGGSGSGSTDLSADGAVGTAHVIDGALNLRTGPGLDYSVLTVMPDAAEVSLTGEYGNGFLGVVYNGTAGYAWADFLATGGAPAPAAPESPAPSADEVTITGSAVITEALNLRSGPSTDTWVQAVMPAGAEVGLTGEVTNGFYGLVYNGMVGYGHGDWISVGGGAEPAPTPEPTAVPTQAPTPAPTEPPAVDQPQAPDPGTVPVGTTVTGTAIVTAGLNVRTGPGLTYPKVAILPPWAKINIMGEPQNGYYPITFVSYRGAEGWVSGDFLNFDGDATPTPANPDQQALIDIIYAAADTYGQPRADMLRVARCESVLDPTAVNPSSGASGLFQFMPGTWRTTPFADQDIFDPVANANAAAWMWANGRRNEWVCQ